MCTEKNINLIIIQNEYSISKKGKDKFIVEIFSQNRFFIVDSITIELINIWKEKNCLNTAANILFDKITYENNLIEFKESSIFKALSLKNNTRDKSLQNYLRLKIIIFDQKSTLNIAKLLKNLINPFVFFLSILLFLIILYINIIIAPKSENIFSPPKTFWFATYLIFLVLFHEFGHVSALYKFTKKSSSIGFGIYLIRPVLFADVTKAWALDKYKRIVINTAGIYFEFIFLIIASFIFLMNSNSINNLIILFFIRCLYNLNPFFRTDGYWVISDYFEMPNLRFKSNTHIKAFLFSKKKDYKLNYYLVFYSLISYVLITFFILKIIVLNFSQIIDFPSNILKLYNKDINVDLFIEHNFIVIIIYLFAFYWVAKKIFELVRKLKTN